MAIKRKILKLEIETEPNKDVRGRITSYTARYVGACGGERGTLESKGDTEERAVELLRERVSRVVAGLGRLAIISDPLVDYQAIVCQGADGYFMYRHLHVGGNLIAFGSCSSSGEETFQTTVSKVRGYAKLRTHKVCYLCDAAKPNSEVTYYATTIDSTMGRTGYSPYYVCKACESLHGVDGTLTALKRRMSHLDPHPLVRCGDVGPDDSHAKIPGSKDR